MARRSALLEAMIGDPAVPLPPFSELDLAAFWRRFDAAAPAHLRAALTLASVTVAVVLPRLRGHRRGLAGLPPDEADDVMQQAARIPGLSSLLEVVKVVACFAYFSDPRVQAAVRAEP